MSSSYPNYEKCKTKLIVGDYCKCLMDEYKLCPQKTSFGICLCNHPDNYKFAIGASSGRKRNAH
jgi:hypothetical protein